jgi:dTDP-4-amino-4,6-dideoxy-D-galactose acyltransferase
LKVIKKEWDSNFFGYPIAEVKKDSFTSEDLDVIKGLAKEKKFDLLYLISHLESKDLENEGCLLADIKVIYKQELKGNVDIDENVFLFTPEEDYQKLITLSLVSGVHSRFKLDANFVNNEFEKLYIEWIKKSVDRNLADVVYVYNPGGQIQGMVTLKINHDKASIGLIAVNAECRGNKIGKKLIDATINYALSNECKYLEVPTQRQNLSACNFYKKNGFSISSTEYIYHLWLKNFNENSI